MAATLSLSRQLFLFSSLPPLQGCRLSIRCSFQQCGILPWSAPYVKLVGKNSKGGIIFASWIGAYNSRLDQTFQFLKKVTISFSGNCCAESGLTGRVILGFQDTVPLSKFVLDGVDCSKPGRTKHANVFSRAFKLALLSTLSIWWSRANQRGHAFCYSHDLMMCLFGHIKYFIACIMDERLRSGSVSRTNSLSSIIL